MLTLLMGRYASLYFIISIDKDENELMALEFIQHYVEVLDQYFGNVAAGGRCEDVGVRAGYHLQLR